MARGKVGLGAVFVATSIVFAIAVLIGLYYWMIDKPLPVPHSPERPNVEWSSPTMVPPSRRLDRV
jgi:hypothetical protein